MNERYIIENTAENLLLQPQSYTHASQTKQNKLHPGSSRDNTSALQPRTKIPEKQQTMHEASEYMTQAFLVRANTEIPQHQHKVLFNTQFFKISFCTNPFSYIPIDCYI